MAKYEYLFSPVQINHLKLDNRIVMAPTHLHLADEDGFMVPRMVDFYLKRAMGGVSMINIGAVGVNPKKMFFVLRVSDDKFIPELLDFTNRIHAETGTKVCAQLFDPLKMARGWKQDVNDMTVDEIEKIVDYFEKGAIRAKEAGFDAIEIHAAHGYIFASFLSLRNKRDDEYGRGVEGRMKIVMDAYTRIRKALGDDYPIGIRINGDEFIVDGNTLHHSRIIARTMAAAGIDYISITAGGKYEDSPGLHPKYQVTVPYPPLGGYSGFRSMPPAYMPEAVNVYLAADIRKTVREAGYSTPIITAGRIPYPKLAESILHNGQADLVALSRPLLRDPDWLQKTRAGKEKEIDRCTYCNSCLDRLLYDEPGFCRYLNE